VRLKFIKEAPISESILEFCVHSRIWCFGGHSCSWNYGLAMQIVVKICVIGRHAAKKPMGRMGFSLGFGTGNGDTG